MYKPRNHCGRVVVDVMNGEGEDLLLQFPVVIQSVYRKLYIVSAPHLHLQYLLFMMRPHMHILHIQVVHPCTACHELEPVHPTAVNKQLQLFTVVLC